MLYMGEKTPELSLFVEKTIDVIESRPLCLESIRSRRVAAGTVLYTSGSVTQD